MALKAFRNSGSLYILLVLGPIKVAFDGQRRRPRRGLGSNTSGSWFDSSLLNFFIIIFAEIMTV